MMSRAAVHARLNITGDSSRVYFTAGPMARRHLCYVQEVGHFRALPGYYTERRGVPSYLLLYTTHGCGQLNYAGQNHDVRPGSVFLIDCRQYQLYRQTGADIWEFYWLHFYGGCSAAYWQAISAAASGCPGEPFDWPEAQAFCENVRQLIRICGQPGLAAEIQSARLIVELLTQVLLAASKLQNRSPEHSRPVRTVLELLGGNPERRWTLAELARLTSLNPQYLMRLFRRETGHSPLAYQQTLRIGRAKDLLRTGEDSVAAIAEQTGFDSSSYFIRVFRKIEGLTPLAYRKKWKDINSVNE